MNYLDSIFFEEYKRLDNILKDIYSYDKNNKSFKPGVTAYLEHMDNNAYNGRQKVYGWEADYKKLKMLRGKRNELAHSNSFSDYNISTENDIEYINSFRQRILDRTDPISLLKRKELEELRRLEELKKRNKAANKNSAIPQSQQKATPHKTESNLNSQNFNNSTNDNNLIGIALIILLIILIFIVCIYISSKLY